MQTGTFMGALLGPLCFGLVAEHSSFTVAWSVTASTAFLGAGFLLASVRQLDRDIAHA